MQVGIKEVRLTARMHEVESLKIQGDSKRALQL
jgi:hypothetical protein